MADDTITGVVFKSRIMYVAFEPLFRRILYVLFCDVTNILASLTFLKKIRATYGSNIIVLSDGVQCYKACRILIKQELYSLEVRINGENNTVKDRTKLFDNYIPYKRINVTVKMYSCL